MIRTTLTLLALMLLAAPVAAQKPPAILLPATAIAGPDGARVTVALEVLPAGTRTLCAASPVPGGGRCVALGEPLIAPWAGVGDTIMVYLFDADLNLLARARARVAARIYLPGVTIQ